MKTPPYPADFPATPSPPKLRFSLTPVSSSGTDEERLTARARDAKNARDGIKYIGDHRPQSKKEKKRKRKKQASGGSEDKAEPPPFKKGKMTTNKSAEESEKIAASTMEGGEKKQAKLSDGDVHEVSNMECNKVPRGGSSTIDSALEALRLSWNTLDLIRNDQSFHTVLRMLVNPRTVFKSQRAAILQSDRGKPSSFSPCMGTRATFQIAAIP